MAYRRNYRSTSAANRNVRFNPSSVYGRSPYRPAAGTGRYDADTVYDNPPAPMIPMRGMRETGALCSSLNIVPQIYTEGILPTEALGNGTYFTDLYNPYNP
ncbi:MAG: hypothetical protein PHO15_04285 [Eubacteriales bacterium]|nr:hypothetical protein [Eubacteriales bacterium]